MENSLTSFGKIRDFPLSRTRDGSALSSMTDIERIQERDDWMESVRKRLAAIMRLVPGWDGYGAGPPPHETVLFTQQILGDVWLRGLPVPDLSPMSSEGIMIEWITRDFEFTLEINSPNEMTFIFENCRTGHTENGPVSRDLQTLNRFFDLVVAASKNSVRAA